MKNGFWMDAQAKLKSGCMLAPVSVIKWPGIIPCTGISPFYRHQPVPEAKLDRGRRVDASSITLYGVWLFQTASHHQLACIGWCVCWIQWTSCHGHNTILNDKLSPTLEVGYELLHEVREGSSCMRKIMPRGDAALQDIIHALLGSLPFPFFSASCSPKKLLYLHCT